MSYRTERETFIARMSTEGLPLHVARLLLREATGINRRAELACSSEAADRDRVPCPQTTPRPRTNPPCMCGVPGGTPHQPVPRIAVQDWRAEQRIQRAIEEVNDRMQNGQAINVTTPALWRFSTDGDPRGYTLRVIPPSYAERNAGWDPHDWDPHDLAEIGVPAGPSGLRW
jgi:hypothetical protein